MRKDVGYSRGFAVDAGNAVEWDHPLNVGRKVWYHSPDGVPGMGARVLDLCGLNHGTCTAGGSSSDFVRRSNAGWLTGSQAGSVNGAYVASPLRAGSGNTSAKYAIAGTVFSSDTTTFQGFFGFRDNAASNANSLYIAHGSTGLTEVRYRPNSITSSTDSTKSYSVGWTRYLVYVVGSNMYVYKNGVLNDTVSVNSGTLNSTCPFWVLRAPYDSTSTGSAIGPVRDVSAWAGDKMASITPALAWMDYQQSITNYRSPDSPLRWFSTRSYSLPSSGSSGVGTASGTCTVSGTGASSSASVASTSGTCTVAGVGRASSASVASASGTCTVSGVGAASSASIASSSGTCTVAAVGASSAASVASASGTCTVSGVGTSASGGQGVGSASGTCTVSGVGASASASVASTTGTGTASAVGAAAIASIFSAVGTCTVNGISPGRLVVDGRTGAAVNMGSRTASAVNLGSRTASAVDQGSRSVIGRAPN